MTDRSDPSSATFTNCGQTTPAVTGTCPVEDLPADPFQALNVDFGMLLGVDDFRVLMGNPRGKQMLHSSWLHGTGVVWGYAAYPDPDDPGRLVVEPGLAVDGWGRELRLELRQCLDLATWSTAWWSTHRPDLSAAATPPPDACAHEPPPGQTPDPAVYHMTAWVVAEFATCLSQAVPALADPCDVTRRHDSFSRVVETVRIRVQDTRSGLASGYRRVRVLLGLVPPDPAKPADVQALKAVERVRAAQPQHRAAVLEAEFRRLAACDATERKPAALPGSSSGLVELSQLPVTEDDAAVALAQLCFEVRVGSNGPAIGPVFVRASGRSAVLPTGVMQDLLCGLAPGLIGPDPIQDAGGPRLDPRSVAWTDGNRVVSFRVDKRVARGSWEGALSVSSLSGSGRGWRREHIDHVALETPDPDGGQRVVIHLDGPPAYPTGRLLIRGTGVTPLFGEQPWVPFAGLIGGPPGTAHDGHDAAVVTHFESPGTTSEGTSS
jgi:hypothetical protein